MLNLPTRLSYQNLFQTNKTLVYNINMAQMHYQFQNDLKTIKQSLEQPIQMEQELEVAQMLRMIIPDDGQFYDKQFVRIFCLIKINSLLSQFCDINLEFVDKLISLYNKNITLNIRLCRNQEQFMAQILFNWQLYKYIKISHVQNILAGQCLLATTLSLMIKKSKDFMRKSQITFAIGFLALSGRPQAFIRKVHQQKNHKGQLQFACTISEYIKIDNPQNHLKISVQSRRVQDPYSMRCAPQVYGVVYQCIDHLMNEFQSILNKFHFKNLSIDGIKFPNMALSADNQVLKGDFLVCSLNQVGSMAFLRSERILNIYLGKNQLHKQKPKEVFELKILLEKTIHCLSDNKVIATPSNIDTMNIDNYERDVFFTASKLYQKFNQMIKNLYKIMLLEVNTALIGLNNVYHINKGEIFLNQIIKKQFFNLSNHISIKKKKQSSIFLQKEWNLQQKTQNQ